jgi:hypothetical protein
VLDRLGELDSRSAGAAWSAGEGARHKTFVRHSSGEVVERYVFAITPHKIPVGAYYTTWTYHNMRGTTWLLFFVKERFRSPSPARVVEVGHYPTGGVF